MNEKPHISHSQLDMYWRCPEQYRRRYMEKEVIPPGIAMLQGTGIHRAAEANFKQKIESREDLPATDIIELAAVAFDTEKSGGYMLTDEEASAGAAKILGAAKDQLIQLASVHAAEQAPDYQPVVVEHVTRIVFPNATHDLVAVTDLRDDKGRVTDLKTAARKKPQSDADSSMQLTIYAAAYRLELGEMPAEVRLDSLIKTKTPGRQVLRSTRTTADFQAMINRVNVTLDAINKGSFPPASPGSWNCSPRWCGFWATCPYVNSERRAAAESE
jgi:hypothetical protein